VDRETLELVRLGILAVVLVTGCYQASPQPGSPCSPEGMCPAGLECDLGVCVSHTMTDGGGDSTPAFDAACGMCSADHTAFVPCSGANVACGLGCITSGGDHCAQLVPANGIDPAWTAGTTAINVGGVATFDTSTGAISGALTRASGTGVKSGIGYYQTTSGTASIGVFAFTSLTITAAGEARFTGSRSAAFLADGMIVIGGKIDVSAGCYGSDRSCAGPGGGAGSIMGTPASGGCAGGNAASSMTNADDGGGGGGGGGESGTVGGTASSAAAGTAGGGCIPVSLEPLRGGGGGGAGGPGASTFPPGGGGGGAIQLTSQTAVVVGGVIVSGGAGGNGGNTMSGSSASAGSGGGGGGGILLEAPTVTVQNGGVVAANGGGGGGGGNSGVGPGSPGAPGGSSTAVAMGGMGVASPGPANGGNGGAGATAPTAGGDGTNGGGGGGGRGMIRVRATTPTLSGTISPTATTAAIVTR